METDLSSRIRQMTRLRSIRTLAIAVCFLQLAIFQMPTVLLACPTCKDGLHEDGTAAAYAISVLFMMGMPFVILACWVTTIIRLRARMSDVPATGLDR